MSSGLGNIKHVGQKWKEAVLNPDLTEEGLTQIMDQFVESVFSTLANSVHSRLPCSVFNLAPSMNVLTA